jgi:hypothetical protein
MGYNTKGAVSFANSDSFVVIPRQATASKSGMITELHVYPDFGSRDMKLAVCATTNTDPYSPDGQAVVAEGDSAFTAVSGADSSVAVSSGTPVVNGDVYRFMLVAAPGGGWPIWGDNISSGVLHYYNKDYPNEFPATVGVTSSAAGNTKVYSVWAIIYAAPSTSEYITKVFGVENDINASSVGTGATRVIKSDSLLNGLLGYWRFEEDVWDGTAGEVIDIIGGNNGTATNAITGNGKLGRGGVFDGSGDFISGTQPFGDVNFKDQAFSLSLWFKNGAVPVDGTLLQICNATASNFGIWLMYLQLVTGIELLFHQCSATTTGRVAIYKYSLGLSAQSGWQHVIVTYDGSGIPTVNTVKIYFNSVEQSLTEGVNTLGYEAETKYRIGQDGATGTVQAYNGTIDELMIYNRAITPDEVRRLYNDGNGMVLI